MSDKAIVTEIPPQTAPHAVRFNTMSIEESPCFQVAAVKKEVISEEEVTQDELEAMQTELETMRIKLEKLKKEAEARARAAEKEVLRTKLEAMQAEIEQYEQCEQSEQSEQCERSGEKRNKDFHSGLGGSAQKKNKNE
jgi:predicted nuclease with TOPRIM domain